MHLSKSVTFCALGILVICSVFLKVIRAESPQSAPDQNETPVDLLEISPGDLSNWLKDVPLKIHQAGILAEERQTYYQVLAYARDVDTKVINKAAHDFFSERMEKFESKGRHYQKFPVFVDLYQNQQLYQGRPVTMSGHIQRSVCSPADANEHGIKNLCEAWLFTEDSQSNPTVIISTSFPKDFPIGEQIVDHVTVTGYIYRMYTYDARDTRRYAPLLMAHEIKWSANSTKVKKSSRLQGLLILLFCIFAFGIILGFVFLMLQRKRKDSLKSATQILSQDNFLPVDFDSIKK